MVTNGFKFPLAYRRFISLSWFTLVVNYSSDLCAFIPRPRLKEQPLSGTQCSHGRGKREKGRENNTDSQNFCSDLASSTAARILLTKASPRTVGWRCTGKSKAIGKGVKSRHKITAYRPLEFFSFTSVYTSPPHPFALPAWPCRYLSWNCWSKGFSPFPSETASWLSPHFFKSPSYYLSQHF